MRTAGPAAPRRGSLTACRVARPPPGAAPGAFPLLPACGRARGRGRCRAWGSPQAAAAGPGPSEPKALPAPRLLAPALAGLCRPLPARGGGRWGAVGEPLGRAGGGARRSPQGWARGSPPDGRAAGRPRSGLGLPRAWLAPGLARLGLSRRNRGVAEAAGGSGFAAVGIRAAAGKASAAPVRRRLGPHHCFCVALALTGLKGGRSPPYCGYAVSDCPAEKPPAYLHPCPGCYGLP